MNDNFHQAACRGDGAVQRGWGAILAMNVIMLHSARSVKLYILFWRVKHAPKKSFRL